jgi:hypothetical protein
MSYRNYATERIHHLSFSQAIITILLGKQQLTFSLFLFVDASVSFFSLIGIWIENKESVRVWINISKQNRNSFDPITEKQIMWKNYCYVDPCIEQTRSWIEKKRFYHHWKDNIKLVISHESEIVSNFIRNNGTLLCFQSRNEFIIVYYLYKNNKRKQFRFSLSWRSTKNCFKRNLYT